MLERRTEQIFWVKLDIAEALEVSSATLNRILRDDKSFPYLEITTSGAPSNGGAAVVARQSSHQATRPRSQWGV